MLSGDAVAEIAGWLLRVPADAVALYGTCKLMRDGVVPVLRDPYVQLVGWTQLQHRRWGRVCTPSTHAQVASENASARQTCSTSLSRECSEVLPGGPKREGAMRSHSGHWKSHAEKLTEFGSAAHVLR